MVSKLKGISVKGSGSASCRSCAKCVKKRALNTAREMDENCFKVARPDNASKKHFSLVRP